MGEGEKVREGEGKRTYDKGIMPSFCGRKEGRQDGQKHKVHQQDDEQAHQRETQEESRGSLTKASS